MPVKKKEVNKFLDLAEKCPHTTRRVAARTSQLLLRQMPTAHTDRLVDLWKPPEASTHEHATRRAHPRRTVHSWNEQNAGPHGCLASFGAVVYPHIAVLRDKGQGPSLPHHLPARHPTTASVPPSLLGDVVLLAAAILAESRPPSFVRPIIAVNTQKRTFGQILTDGDGWTKSTTSATNSGW